MPTEAPRDAFHNKMRDIARKVGVLEASLTRQRSRVDRQLSTVAEVKAGLRELTVLDDPREVWLHQDTGTWHSVTDPCGHAPKPGSDGAGTRFVRRFLSDVRPGARCGFCGDRA